MPELPEVETIARQLNAKLAGRKVVGVEVLREKSFLGAAGELERRRVRRVGRRAKMVCFEFDGWHKVLVAHLKMTGQLVWRLKFWDERHVERGVVGGHPSEGWVRELPDKHTRVVIKFADGSRLFFNDMRVFGWIRLMSRRDWDGLVKKLPPDVVDKEFDLGYFAGVLRGSGRAVKLVVMDGNKVGGVGNIYANEALNLAKVDPRRLAKSLNGEEIERLYKALKKVIKWGIKYGGASYADFRDTRGLGGRYQEHFLVYKREGQRCRNCGGKIKKMYLGGRGTYCCVRCQK